MISRFFVTLSIVFFNSTIYCQNDRVDSLVKVFEPWRIDNTPCMMIRDSLFHELKIRPNQECSLLGVRRKEIEAILGKPTRRGWFSFEYQLLNEKYCQNYSPPIVIKFGFCLGKLSSASIHV